MAQHFEIICIHHRKIYHVFFELHCLHLYLEPGQNQYDYKGSNFYSQIIRYLMAAIYNENAYLTLTRIGLRKFDSLVFKDLNNIE